MIEERSPRSLLWLYYLYIISLPFYSFSLLNVGERGLGRPDWLLGISMVAVFGFGLARGRMRVRHTPSNKFVVFFVYSALLSAMGLWGATTAQYQDFGTKALQLLLVTGVFFAISSLSLNEQELKNLLRLWFLVALVVAGYALYQLPARIFDWPFASITLSNPSTAPRGVQTARTFGWLGDELVVVGKRSISVGYVQVSSFLREPTWLASYLQTGLIFFAVLLLGKPGQRVLSRSVAWNWIAWSIMLLGLLLSVALGSYVSFLIVLILIFLLQRVYKLKATRLIFLVVVLFLLCGYLLSLSGIAFFDVAFDRIGDLFGELTGVSGARGTSLGGREQRAVVAFDIWATHPIFGVGLNNTHHYMTGPVQTINSGWVELLSSQGLLGVIAMLLLLGSLARELNRLLRMVDPTSWWYFLIVGLLFAVVNDAIDTFVTFNWTHTMRWFTLSMANLVCVQARARFDSPHSRPPERRSGNVVL